jgi:hypothetical protein
LRGPISFTPARTLEWDDPRGSQIYTCGWYPDNTNYTVSNSIISEGFNASSGHYGHGIQTGDIVGLTLYHNLFAHNRDRAPRLGSASGDRIEDTVSAEGLRHTIGGEDCWLHAAHPDS